MSLEDAIQEAIDLKEEVGGDTQFSLHYDSDWVAMIGNPVTAVSLGESVGEFYCHGDTALDAVLGMIILMKQAQS